MSKKIIKAGLTGKEKKLANIFGGVAVENTDRGFVATFVNGDVFVPSYGEAITTTPLEEMGNTMTSAAKKLLKIAQFNVEAGRVFYSRDGHDYDYRSETFAPRIDALIEAEFKSQIIPCPSRS